MNFLQQLKQMNNSDGALDRIFDFANQAMFDGEFDELDKVLKEVDVEEYSLDVLIGFLTATLPAASKLTHRTGLRRRIRKEAWRRKEWQKNLLDGL